MKLSKAVTIFFHIDSDQYTDEEKGTAIMKVAQMPTHNGVTKDSMLLVIWYLLNLCFDIPADAEGPKRWIKGKEQI